MFKQMIAVRKDLRMGKGKTAAQVAHASVGAFKLAEKKTPEQAKLWWDSGMKKIVVYVNDQRELFELKESLPAKIPRFVVSDAGMTQLKPGTVTCIGIGPAHEEELEKYTGELKLV